MLTDPDLIAEHALRLAAADGIGSVCVHGDTPDAVHHARAVRARLEADGWTLRPFVT